MRKKLVLLALIIAATLTSTFAFAEQGYDCYCAARCICEVQHP